MRPSSRIQRFPAWRSPWNGPWTQAASNHAFTASRSSRCPVSASPAKRSTGVPWIRCMQITRGPHSSQYTSGEVTSRLSPNAWRLARNRVWRSASSAKLSSWLVTRCRSVITATGFAMRRWRLRAASRARRYRIRRSVFTCVGETRSLHLHHRLATVVQRAGVDLGDRRRGERDGIEGGERLVRIDAEVGRDHLAHVVDADGRDPVEGAPARRGQGGREQPGRRGDELAELHERRAQVARTHRRSRRRRPRPARRRREATSGSADAHPSQDDDGDERGSTQLGDAEPIDRRVVDGERGFGGPSAKGPRTRARAGSGRHRPRLARLGRGRDEQRVPARSGPAVSSVARGRRQHERAAQADRSAPP